MIVLGIIVTFASLKFKWVFSALQYHSNGVGTPKGLITPQEVMCLNIRYAAAATAREPSSQIIMEDPLYANDFLSSPLLSLSTIIWEEEEEEGRC